ncbi:De-etiolated protein 1 Det1-domain-containing protein [Halteromyces radiatus]|uniref:De-etiolated protein 1 Det1-domain-containing protein n=1 Tax=Halteromyces radiatus TaxID=101107 RepID=UPI00221E6A30|nr:De-etiolated protein 1 Det1-domain-containing protein [Halteromyces radiatus]KAI8090005.1 De-etiolated protein 1 Det1-domain-containing protein [Halteromyces radiatus]
MILYDHIQKRQLRNGRKDKRISLLNARSVYTDLVPNHIIYKVHIPLDIHILRFTFDGKYLICLSKSSNKIILYYTKTCVYPWSATNNPLSPAEEQFCFSHFFRLKYEQTVQVPTGHILCKDFCLVINSNYLVLASTKVLYATANGNPVYPSTLESFNVLIDYVFYSIDIESGQVVSQYKMPFDFLHINHHACVSVYGQVLSILSLKYQTIKLILLDVHGNFHELRSIGRFLNPDDELVIHRHQQQNQAYMLQKWKNLKKQALPKGAIETNDMDEASLHSPSSHLEDDVQGLDSFITAARMDMTINSMMGGEQLDDDTDPWQVLIDFGIDVQLHRFCMSESDGGIASRQFFRNYNVYTRMKFWRLQFLDEQHILIKLAPDTATLTPKPDGTVVCSSPFMLFVIFNIETNQIDDLFDQSSEKVLELFKDYADTIQGRSPEGTVWFGSNCRNHPEAEAMLMKQVHSWSSSNQGSRKEAIKKLSMELPIPCQSYMDSPYFDLSLFAYDENLISPTDRKLKFANQIVKFYSSYHHQCMFKINPNPPPSDFESSENLSRRLSIMIPHPSYPLIITKQYSSNNSPVINFHVYKSPDTI